MAATNALKPGMDVTISKGDYAGLMATIVGPTRINDKTGKPEVYAYPDGHPEQRKIDVMLPDLSIDGEPFHTTILPRLIDMTTGDITPSTNTPDLPAMLSLITNHIADMSRLAHALTNIINKENNK